MIVIGVTGPSGAGKGELCRILRDFHVHVIDADVVYHNVISPPSPCLDELVKAFGNSIIAYDGSLDRRALSAIVFDPECPDNLELLNGITHKYVVNKIRSEIFHMRRSDVAACAIDAPLLIEAGLLSDCNFSIAVIADNHLRVQRISHRDGISEQAARMRISSQKSDQYYIDNTDYVVYNNGEISEVDAQVRDILINRSVISK